MPSVWITGASSGIGKALALLLASRGYHIIATARDSEALQLLAASSDHIVALPADLTRADHLQALRDWFLARNEALDVVVVNAGTCVYMDESRLEMAALRQVFELNVFAAAGTVDIALPWLKQSAHGGHVVGISSMSVYLPFTRAEYYGASKAAFTYYLQSLAVDLKPEGIDVTVVFPGFVDTPLTGRNDFAMPFLMTPEAAAKKLLQVIKKRPATAAFPEPLHLILRIVGKMPRLWARLHKPAGTKLKENEG